MKRNKFILYSLLGIGIILSLCQCTDLSEKPYDIITADNFYQNKTDVYRSFLRTFDHGYWSIQNAMYLLQEDSGDQIATYNREGDWEDGGVYYRLHYHTWTPLDWYCNNGWVDNYQGIAYANNSLEDIQALDVSKFGMTTTEQKMLCAELRTMRAWYYIRLLDLYRNIPIATKNKGSEQFIAQSTPQETFNFIEKELKEAIPDLAAKGDSGTEHFEGRWTKAGAAALLERLYLNAKVYIGVDRFDDCAAVCTDIISGKYGHYEIASRWDAPFDWDNEQCDETIFAFPGSFGYTHWHYSGGMNWVGIPYYAPNYLEFTDWGMSNPRFAMQPGHDVAGKEYSFDLGKPLIKYQRYSDDVRLKLYKNLGNSTREGMFLSGYLIYNNGQDTVKSTRGYTIYLRDQVGWFKSLTPNQVPTDQTSSMAHADQNSGICLVKYPLYKSKDAHKIGSGYAEVRLAEIYYALAECKFRKGYKAEAEKLLNTVRCRYYPAGSSSLYPEDGSVLTESELLDEWGREFLGESRRRTDLIRFGKFNSGTWWDKIPDADTHTQIYPIGQNVLTSQPQLKQNPGY